MEPTNKALFFQAIQSAALDTTKSTGGIGAINFEAYTKSGTNIATPATNSNLLSIKSGSGTRFIFDAEGTIHHASGSGDSSFDLLTAIVTGTPTFGWNETQDQFTINKGLLLTSGFIDRSTTATITASTTQTQGQGALTSEINEVSVCANINDTVTLPVAVAGRRVVIINNGAQTLQIFPASGDNLGAGVDTATTLASGSNVVYQAFDATNWEAI